MENKKGSSKIFFMPVRRQSGRIPPNHQPTLASNTSCYGRLHFCCSERWPCLVSQTNPAFIKHLTTIGNALRAIRSALLPPASRPVRSSSTTPTKRPSSRVSCAHSTFLPPHSCSFFPPPACSSAASPCATHAPSISMTRPTSAMSQAARSKSFQWILTWAACFTSLIFPAPQPFPTSSVLPVA